MNWSIFHSHYIEIWNNRYNFLLIRNTIFVPELACYPDYMPWFRIHGKPYLLNEENRRRHPHTSRPRWAPLNPMSGETGPSSVPTQEPASMASAPPLTTSPSCCTVLFWLDYRSFITDLAHSRAISFPNGGER
ncbi:hypothetical protein Golax_003780 [Gossypium laxum]|uniref:Uncharacterized protein n=1 Tax=Gossypium laxum TaxID=34288 RepID=A0A7J9AGW0_9ROSI|nr:hypothetical protein [Gossypium laxum]